METFYCLIFEGWDKGLKIFPCKWVGTKEIFQIFVLIKSLKWIKLSAMSSELRVFIPGRQLKHLQCNQTAIFTNFTPNCSTRVSLIIFLVGRNSVNGYFNRSAAWNDGWTLIKWMDDSEEICSGRLLNWDYPVELENG